MVSLKLNEKYYLQLMTLYLITLTNNINCICLAMVILPPLTALDSTAE